jgi:hypothetical protein
MSDGLSLWLRIWSLAVIGFGLVLAAGAVPGLDAPTQLLFTVLGGKPAALSQETRFALGVLGGVAIGWGLAMMIVFREAARLGEAAAPLLRGVALAVIVWFVIDSALSIATGYTLNVVPNLILLAGLIVPLWRAGLLAGARA